MLDLYKQELIDNTAFHIAMNVVTQLSTQMLYFWT